MGTKRGEGAVNSKHKKCINGKKKKKEEEDNQKIKEIFGNIGKNKKY